MASEQLTLIEFLKILFGTGPESIQMRDYFEQDPEAALAEHGLGHLTAEDVRDAAVLLQDNDTVSFDRSYDTGFDWDDGNAGWAWKPGADGHHDGGQHHGAEHVTTHVTDNHHSYDVDDRDTILDQSVNQNVDTGGGDFRQSIENDSVNATGDGAVAAGDDITGSVITTGDGNVVGNDNQVVDGDGNTAAFGSGSAVSGVRVDDGGAFSVDGPASGNASVNDSFNETTTSTTTTNETDYDDSFNTTTDNSTTTEFVDNSETSIGSGNEIDLGIG